MSDAATRLNAALEGRYEIERELGEGGMATVYLAKDLKHNRNVALKVLKPELAAVVGAERFLAEIETTANLQHPHILPLFDSGEADSFLFYVMPYVEGETLRERIDRENQLPVDEALGIATSVASALQHAHDRGVIHRDIKPGNILLQDGQPVVADFGIALAVGAAGGTRLTETGLSVGTPYYMSPEQATGDQGVGPASDTYALACVLYELLVGEPPFPGKTAQAVLGKIIQGAPVSATAIRKSIPPNVDAAIRKALEKLPADRFGGATEFAKALTDAGFRHGSAAVASADSTGWRSVAFALGLIAVLAGAGLVAIASRAEAPDPVIRYTLRFGEGEEPVTSGGAFGTSLSLSPGGGRMAYIGPSEEGPGQVWVRERDQLEGEPLTGTEGGVQPFFSPDGRRVGFIVTGTRQLKVASLGGEPPLTLVDSTVFRLGAAWGLDGYIYYSAQPDGGIYRVPATGGAIEQISTPDTDRNETRHAWPDALPGGRGLLVTVQRGQNVYTPEDDIGVLDLETGEVTIIFRGTLARYLPTGHVVFVTHEGDLMVATFDERRLEITGPTVPLLSGITGNIRGPDVALSRSGRLAYAPVLESTEMELVWVDRAGRARPVEEGWAIRPAGNAGPSLSPDDRRIAIDLLTDGGTDLWVKQLDGPLTRLAFGGWNGRASWSADGRSVVYMSGDLGANFDVWTQRADGSEEPQVLLDLEPDLAEGRWTPDGEWLLVRLNAPTQDIFGFRPDVDTVPVPLVATDFVETAPSVSPDGRFLAYVANASGRSEVYVRPFPDVNRGRVQISTDGGVEPVWANGGGEIFYKNEARELVAARVDTSGDLAVLGREVLFPLPPGASYYYQYAQYDVTQDDQQFLMYRLAAGTPLPVTDEYIVVENFHEELRQRVPN
jgi:serine/threonine-protein kinase